MANVFDLYGKISIDTSGFLSALSIAQKAISVTAKSVTNFAKSSVQTGMTFDKSMSQVAATMGKTTSEMQEQVGTVDLAWGEFTGNLREYALEMGKNTAFSASQAADALNYMALAGYDTQTSMEMLPNVLNLAAAGTMDLARASDMVTDTQTAFGITIERTMQMVDEMAKAASTGNTSVSQLGDAFLVVGGLAQELNGGIVSLSDGTTATVDGIQELEIALTGMANAGIKGSEAGTHMRNMLLKLSSPSDSGVAQMEALGVSVFDTSGKMRSLSNVFGDLRVSLSKLTQEKKIQAISDIFNARDIASAEALLAAVNQDWDKIGESILNADGAAAQMAETQLDNLAGDVTRFNSALEGIQIALSDKLTPTLRKFVQFGTDGLSRLTTAFNEKGLLGAMSEFGSILSDGLLMIVEMTPQILEVGSAILSAIGQGILDNLPMILDVIVKVVEQIITDLGRALPTLISALPKFIESLMNAIDWDNLLDIIINIIDIIADALIDVLPQLTEAVMTLIEKIVEFVLKPETLSKLVELCAKVMIAVSTALLAAAPKLLVGVGKIIKVVVDYIVNTDWKKLGQDLINNINKAISKAAEKLMKWWDGWSQEIGKYAVIAWNKVVEVWSGVGQWFSDRWQDIKNAFKSVGDWFKMVFEGAWNGITGAFSAVGNFFNNVWNGIKNAFITTGEWFGNVFTGAWNGIKNAFSNVKNFFVEVWNGIKSVFTNVGTWFTDIFKRAWEGIKNVFAPVGTTFQNIGDSILNGLKSVVNSLIWGINQIISLPFNKLNDALRGIKGIDILGAKPFDWINEIAVPQIPYLAKGGVLKRGQMAFLEGQGDEAVIPLSQNTEWIDKVAEKLGEKRQSVYYNFEIHIDKMGQTSEDDIEQFADRLMEVMNEKESRRRYVMV
jgi:TP901 family phage tail tape measure protein